MGLENIIGLMVEFIKDSGEIIKCMDKAHINGPMEDHILDITLTIRNMV